MNGKQAKAVKGKAASIRALLGGAGKVGGKVGAPVKAGAGQRRIGVVQVGSQGTGRNRILVGPGTRSDKGMGPKGPGGALGVPLEATPATIARFLSDLRAVAGKLTPRGRLALGVTPNDDGVGIPVNVARTIEGPITHIEPNSHERAGEVLAIGSELLTEITVPAQSAGPINGVVPKGGIFAAIPLNPMYIDGVRVAKMLEQYDQYCLEQVSIEYVPVTSALQAGGLSMAVINDADDALGLEGGFPAVRDTLSRPGSVAFNVYAPAVAGQNTPLLKWYFTGRNQDSELVIPGVVYCMATTTFTNNTTADIPLGLLWLHYKIRLRSPSIERPITMAYSASSAILGYTASTSVAGTALSVAAAGCGLTANLIQPGVIYWGSIAGVDDAAWGSATWRTLRDPASNDLVVPGLGSLIYWRVHNNGFLYLFESLGAAMNFDAQAVNALLATVLGIAGTIRSFRLFNVSGSDALGSA
jgi:hypothetical protein